MVDIENIKSLLEVAIQNHKIINFKYRHNFFEQKRTACPIECKDGKLWVYQISGYSERKSLGLKSFLIRLITHVEVTDEVCDIDSLSKGT